MSLLRYKQVAPLVHKIVNFVFLSFFPGTCCVLRKKIPELKNFSDNTFDDYEGGENLSANCRHNNLPNLSLHFSSLRSDYSAAPFVQKLYETAFPTYERRDWQQLENMLSLPDMQVVVARQDNIPVGFAIYWPIHGWYFLEHLAIHPQYEGKGYGGQMINWLLQKSHHQLFLEAELPTDEASRRRIRFYQKSGFEIAPFPYRQPPYRRDETTPAMHILSVPSVTDAATFHLLTGAVRKQVFEAFY